MKNAKLGDKAKSGRLVFFFVIILPFVFHSLFYIFFWFRCSVYCAFERQIASSKTPRNDV